MQAWLQVASTPWHPHDNSLFLGEATSDSVNPQTWCYTTRYMIHFITDDIIKESRYLQFAKRTSTPEEITQHAQPSTSHSVSQASNFNYKNVHIEMC